MDPVILEDLRKAYESGQLIIFVGAGVSASVRLPNWKKLAEMLRDRCQKAGAEEAKLEEMDEYIRKDRLINAISLARDVLGLDFELAVRSALDDKDKPIPEAAKAIVALRERLWAVITTNLDRLLERAFAGEWPDLTNPPGDLGQERHYILKLHGTLRDARTWTFTRAQYDKMIFASPQVESAFRALYRTRKLLFVGFGLEDENIEQTLGEMRALSEGQPPTHFALIAKGELKSLRRRELRESGIRLIEYPNAHGDHREVVEVLRWLAAPAGTPIPGSADPPPPAFTAAPVAAAPPPVPELPLVQPMLPDVAPTPADGPVDTFICYAPGDADLVKRLETHLTMIRREKLIAPWSLGQVGAGEEFGAEARERLARARLILLLVSIDFLASDEHDEQVAFAMEQHRRRAARVVPILLRQCHWEDTGRFKDLQVLPRNKVPVKQWKDEDEAFTQIARELRDVVRKLRSC